MNWKNKVLNNFGTTQQFVLQTFQALENDLFNCLSIHGSAIQP